MHNSELNLSLNFGLGFCFRLAFGLGLGALCLQPHCHGGVRCRLMDFYGFLSSTRNISEQSHRLVEASASAGGSASSLKFQHSKSQECVEIRGIGVDGMVDEAQPFGR